MVMFISARTERIAVTRSITQPISAGLLVGDRPGWPRRQREQARARRSAFAVPATAPRSRTA
jgi:hypothetical protein